MSSACAFFPNIINMDNDRQTCSLASKSQDAGSTGSCISESQATSEQESHCAAHLCFYEEEDDEYLIHGNLFFQPAPQPQQSQKYELSRLITAAQEGDVEGVRKLLQEGAQLNRTDIFGRTGLHHAAANGHAEVARILLASNAYVDHPDHDGSTPLHLALRSRSHAAVEVLLEHGANVHCVMNACGKTPWKLAREAGDEVLLRLLGSHGAHA